MPDLLLLCLLGFIVGGLLLAMFIFALVFIKQKGVFGEQDSATVLLISGIFSVVLLALGIYNCVEGNKEYDKVTQIYSLQPSERFILGVSKGHYYYNLNDTDTLSCVDKVFAEETTLIQEENLEHPYLLEHKVKWEKSEYFLYVPEDVRMIQYLVE